ncbi:hypothetical protein AB0P36_35225 [Streptomyces flavidovirens]|uniref:hypothetical protein n=1 Tax=Streptomyces flavidovirens TaxID=67298 RepID=UPI00341C2052
MITGVAPHGHHHAPLRPPGPAIDTNPESVAGARAVRDLSALIARIADDGHAVLFGITCSFLVGCFIDRSDIDLFCYIPLATPPIESCSTTPASSSRTQERA